MNGIVTRAQQEIERRITQAVIAERQERMTQTMLLLNEWGFSYERITAAVDKIFGERFTIPAVKMRVRGRKAKSQSKPQSDIKQRND